MADTETSMLDQIDPNAVIHPAGGASSVDTAAGWFSSSTTQPNWQRAASWGKFTRADLTSFVTSSYPSLGIWRDSLYEAAAFTRASG